jgi:hypothetical protein
MTARIGLYLDDLTHEAVTAYAQLHRVTFDQAARILISIGLETSGSSLARIASDAHLREHGMLELPE